MQRLESELLREAKRLISRNESRQRLLAEENARRARRTTRAYAILKLPQPRQWALHDGFNPFLTRARSACIAHSIRARFASRTYKPRRPVAFDVPKSDGSARQVCIYQVADSAVSKMIFEGALKKNLPILSPRAYAYRKDVSAQNAIQYVQSEFKGRSRLFVAEYDFSRYFDNIDHEHIKRVLADHFLLTAAERHAVTEFLEVAPCGEVDYSPEGGDTRQRGIPQGTSISLFLANVAAWELDRALERIGVGFARYADDTLIWSVDYGRICEAADHLHQYSKGIGVSVNSQKSPGVRLLVPTGAPAEMEATQNVDYLGYRLGLGVTTLRESSIEKMRARISQLTYWGLLCEPMRSAQNPGRFAGEVDSDYVSVIWRLRRYLYGDLSEKEVRRYQRKEVPLRRFRGVMSAYPLVDDGQDLEELDTWIVDHLFLTMRKRSRLLRAQGFGPELPVPHNVPRSSLRTLTGRSSATGQTIDLAVPSVRRIARVIRAAASRHGPGVVGRADPYHY